jgi:hypothetical protein
MRMLPWLALMLLVIWAVLRLALAVTSGMLHLLWIFAVISFVVYLFSHLGGGGRRAT